MNWDGSRKSKTIYDLRLSPELNQSMLKFCEEMTEMTGVKVTRPYILREGAKMLMFHWRKRMRAALRGELEARRRPGGADGIPSAVFPKKGRPRKLDLKIVPPGKPAKKAGPTF